MTVRQIYRKLKETLERSGLEFPAAESAAMLASVCGFDRSALILNGESQCPQEQENRLLQLCGQRISGRPLQYVLGEERFCGAVFKVGEGVLIPRCDTEVLTDACVKLLRERGVNSPRILDLCSGSGNIAVTLKREFPSAEVSALEKSDAAFFYLERNIKLNGVSVCAVKGDVFTSYEHFADARFDLIVSNPPYIKSSDIPNLQSEVLKEPLIALDGGADGCDFYRCIVRCWSGKIKSGGALAFELGEDQAQTVAELMEQAGFIDICTHNDLGGVQRAVNGIRA